jgi:hypothetical protein
MYRIIHNIIKNKSNYIELAIPSFVLFDENVDYIDMIRNDYVKYNPVYDDEIECFVFKGVNNLFLGIKEILKKIHTECPNDPYIMDHLNKIEIFLKIANYTIDMDELCDVLNNNLNM